MAAPARRRLRPDRRRRLPPALHPLLPGDQGVLRARPRPARARAAWWSSTSATRRATTTSSRCSARTMAAVFPTVLRDPVEQTNTLLLGSEAPGLGGAAARPRRATRCTATSRELARIDAARLGAAAARRRGLHRRPRPGRVADRPLDPRLRRGPLSARRDGCANSRRALTAPSSRRRCLALAGFGLAPADPAPPVDGEVGEEGDDAADRAGQHPGGEALGGAQALTTVWRRSRSGSTSQRRPASTRSSLSGQRSARALAVVVRARALERHRARVVADRPDLVDVCVGRGAARAAPRARRACPRSGARRRRAPGSGSARRRRPASWARFH